MDFHKNAKDSNAHKIAIFIIFDIKPELVMAEKFRKFGCDRGKFCFKRNKVYSIYGYANQLS